MNSTQLSMAAFPPWPDMNWTGLSPADRANSNAGWRHFTTTIRSSSTPAAQSGWRSPSRISRPITSFMPVIAAVSPTVRGTRWRSPLRSLRQSTRPALPAFLPGASAGTPPQRRPHGSILVAELIPPAFRHRARHHAIGGHGVMLSGRGWCWVGRCRRRRLR